MPISSSKHANKNTGLSNSMGIGQLRSAGIGQQIRFFQLCIGCQEKNSVIREKSLRFLSTEKATNWNYSELTIQGSTEDDTTFEALPFYLKTGFSLSDQLRVRF